jgi:hypothetical protein
VNRYQELILVTATVYQPGQLVETPADTTNRVLWEFADQHPGAATYECRVIRFTIEPLPNPLFMPPNWKSFIDMTLCESPCRSFFEVDAREEWRYIVERRLIDTPSLKLVRFYAVYNVVENVLRDDEGGKHTDLSIEFAGELDLFVSQRAKFEMEIIRVLASDAPKDGVEIAKALEWQPNDPDFLETLEHLLDEGVIERRDRRAWVFALAAHVQERL